MNLIQCKSYAKLNLHLRITGLQQDRYHLLQMLSIKISLFDLLRIHIERKSGPIIVKTIPFAVSQEENLVYKAIKAYGVENNPAMTVMIHKNIPLMAGLGGGSSNAATILRVLNHFFKQYSKVELQNIGFRIGCDVPFFLNGKEGIITSLGEQIQPTEFFHESWYFVIVKPAFSLSTKEVYCKWDQLHFPLSQSIVFDPTNVLSFYNDLIPAATSIKPELAQVLTAIQDTQPIACSMTGSGSACFGCYPSYTCAVTAQQILSKQYPAVFLAKKQ